MTRPPGGDFAAQWNQICADCSRITNGFVVVGFDGSPASRGALAFAAGWGRRNAAWLGIVYVEQMTVQYVAEAICAATAVPVVQCQPQDLSAEVAEAMTGSPLPWTYVATSGDVASELECLADKLRADAIIVGRSARRARAMRTSVSRRLVASPHRIVVVVP
jgi:nucleotide-binding universal stress UspA family protein